MLGVDTVVVCDGAVLGKPADAGDAERMLETLAGTTHEVVSGLCLRTWREELHRETTSVTFRPLTARDIACLHAAEEWRERAGALIQGLRLACRADRGRLPKRRGASGGALADSRRSASRGRMASADRDVSWCCGHWTRPESTPSATNAS